MRGAARFAGRADPRPAPYASAQPVGAHAPHVRLVGVCSGQGSWLLVTPGWTAALGLTPAHFIGESYVSSTGRLLALDGVQDARVFMARFEVEFGAGHDVQQLLVELSEIADWVALNPIACAA